MVREMEEQTGGWLPVGQDPWAPCLGEGSFFALILPCWGALRERVVSCEWQRQTAGKEGAPLTPHIPGSPPCPLYLVVVWDPWNWAAVAVSQELLPEAERDGRRELSGCSPELGDRGGHICLPQLPP